MNYTFLNVHNYTEAFQLKQEKIQIEHQYGYRAFIGASQLQPQRHTINNSNYALASDLVNHQKTTKLTFAREEIAREIAASGRQNDVNRLIERITRTDCKLTIIHGPSGVGKSSILRAGLVPTLQSQPIGERLAMPIVIGAYADWVTALGRNFNQIMTQMDLAVNLEITPALLLENIRLLTENNYTVILIFDQFEEFFFTKKHHLRKKQFYDFFSQCFELSFVKVIVSIREDYLHYLLEFERLGVENNNSAYNLGVINQNILDKDIRYYLGKFSVQDAIGVIDVLTQSSHYELTNELINQLVQDLASDVDEVHPIELQIVGAQLQAEKITTLSEYNDSGGSQKLVLRWLEEVIKDCGR
ncbi:MAG: ATP-binding protein, partial [Calothrix sp. SM1_7_51]|nr:ATP-binding protein [Calothrix sp. SM1_7_51]